MSTYSKCPKCEITAKSSFNECPRCGVIVSKFLQKAKGDKLADRKEAAGKNADLQNLAQANILVIRQQKEWGEFLPDSRRKTGMQSWTFQIKKGGQELGKITKKWSGLVKESFTDADNFGITFPSGIDLSQKAVLLGAVFLIDFVHFENSGNRN